MRIVVDTNLWISFLIGKRVQAMQQVLADPRVELIITSRLISEIENVLLRPKLSKYVDKKKTESFIFWLSNNATNIPVNNIPCRCRDPKDDYLLELAVCSNAIFLVSGDSDLLDLQEVEGCRIITFNQFLNELSSQTTNAKF